MHCKQRLKQKDRIQDDDFASATIQLLWVALFYYKSLDLHVVTKKRFATSFSTFTGFLYSINI